MDNSTLSRRRLLGLSLGLVSALVIAGCGGNKPAPTTGSQVAPADQQVLRVRLTSEPKSLDPQLMNSTNETTLAKPLFAGLFTYDQELKVVPNLAADLPTDANGGISKDGLTYTVHLKKDLKWSDGKPISASDFVYGMQRALDPTVASPYATFFYPLNGAKEFNTALGTKDAPKTPSSGDLAALRDKLGVSAKDASTVVYQLREPTPSFLNLLALWTSFPVRQDIVEKYGAKWTEAGNDVTSGAFMLKAWTHDQRLVMEPNPFWTGEKPKLSRIEVNFIPDDAAAYAAYRADQLDVVTIPPSVSKEVASPASPLNKEFVHLPTLSTYALFYNNQVAPFDNVKVREAFGMAIDRKAYVDGVLQGAGVPTTTWIAPGMPGYDASLGKQYEFNPTKAKQLLAEAGYPDGKGLPKVTFLSIASDTNKVVGQFIQDQIKKNLGVTVDTEYVDGKTFGARFTANQHQVTIQRWNADWPYPDNWLPDLFGTGNSNNHANWSNAKFDDLMKKAKAEVDEKKRLAIYDDAQKLMLDDAAVVPLYNPEVDILVKPKVKGLVITALDGAIKGDYNLQKVYIAGSTNN